MGSCSCVQRSENGNIDIDPQRLRDLSMFYINAIENSFKNNIKAMLCLKQLQARVKGVYVRNKVKSMGKVRKYMPNDSYLRFTTIPNNKIVNFK